MKETLSEFHYDFKYKVNRKLEYISIRYIGAVGSIDPTLPIFGSRTWCHHKKIHPYFNTRPHRSTNIFGEKLAIWRALFVQSFTLITLLMLDFYTVKWKNEMEVSSSYLETVRRRWRRYRHVRSPQRNLLKTK